MNTRCNILGGQELSNELSLNFKWLFKAVRETIMQPKTQSLTSDTLRFSVTVFYVIEGPFQKKRLNQLNALFRRITRELVVPVTKLIILIKPKKTSNTK